MAIPAQLYYHTRPLPKVHPLSRFDPFALLPTSLCLCSLRLATTRNPFAEGILLCHKPALLCHAHPPVSEIPHHYTITFRPFASLPKSLYRCPPCFTITPKPFAFLLVHMCVVTDVLAFLWRFLFDCLSLSLLLSRLVTSVCFSVCLFLLIRCILSGHFRGACSIVLGCEHHECLT